MRAVEDAIARQVFHGGDLATNLLELGASREETLMALVAESFGLDAAPAGRLQLPGPDVLRLVPGDLSSRHGIFPLALREGVAGAAPGNPARALVVAVAEPLPAAVEDDLGFALDVSIRQVVAPLVRIRQAIADAYGIALDRRFARLQAKLDGTHDPSPSALPPAEQELPPARMPRGVSIPVPSFGTGLDGGGDVDPARLEDKPAAKTPFAAHPQDFFNPRIPRSPALPADVFHAEDAPAAEPPRPAEPSAPAATEAPRSPGATRALAGVLRQALQQERAVDKTVNEARPRWAAATARLGQPRRKGPFTTAMAEEELESAKASDEVLAVLFAFAHQFFEYAALFVVHGDLAEGRDAAGPGADRARVAGIGVPLDLPSSLAVARERRAPVVGALAADGLDADLARDLGRAALVLGDEVRPARAVALVPVAVRTRTVAILYGDDGDADVTLSALSDVVAIVGLAGAAFERIALRKKLGPRAPEVPLKVRIQDGAAALARAISASAADVATRARAAPAAPEPAAKERDEAPVAMFAELPPPAVLREEISDALAMGAPEPVAEEAPVPPGPRTARYFDGPESPPLKRPTDPGIGIRFPDDDDPDDSDEAPYTPPPRAFDSWIPVASPVAAAEPTPPPVSESSPSVRRGSPGRRGPAPLYEGRSAALPEGASVEWVGGSEPTVDSAAPALSDAQRRRDATRTLPSMGLGPLPSTPPPNATAWTSFPSPPPPPLVSVVSARRSAPHTAPLRREEDSSDDGFFDSGPDRVVLAADPPQPGATMEAGAEHKDLIQRAIDGGQRGQDAFDELVRNGEAVIQAVMARFPGPLRVDRHRARGELPPASQCGPILELLVAIRRPALPFVSVRTSALDPDVRFWATHVLGELRYPEAGTVLIPRLFDDDAQVRRIARRSAAALVSAGAAGAPILRGLEDITRNPDQPRPHRVLAIETMGEIRSGSLVPPLLAALEDSSEEVADAARRALLLITRQDFGRDGLRWYEWWANNSGRHRVEWLVDALMHDLPSVRRAAGDELKLLTKEYFGYYDDLPKRERERAQSLYRAWWEREGRQRFGNT
jgi:hypothetical protein